MYCSKCGADNVDTQRFCTKCGTELQTQNEPNSTQNIVTTDSQPIYQNNFQSGQPNNYHNGNLQGQYVYAGFWLRFLAYLIDGIVIGAVIGILSTIAIIIFFISQASNLEGLQNSGPDESTILALIGAYFIFILISVIITCLYYTLMESSANQGTLGKMALGIKVTDMKGERISFGRANGRYWSKIFSGILLIGYIMAGFTEKKQALHDMIASTLVIKK